ncbi:peptidylprolyl isomerase [Buchnera aphidicola]|uniref:Chaperone SurA n=1 Tax=Buchnera aphidicola subsp. Rhopalosiphum maidis TaxID=118109 RepID=A0A3G2I6U0_BUCRM|nr:peptidylprolyl isomerase [Buchnera aphidicola]AYN24901.1 peptidylprolyl isomerase [Buchnera aphidicola (Rhopalosiphum maidis)]
MKVYFFLILYVFSSFFSIVVSKELEIDKIAAVVNDQIILNSDVNQVLFSFKEEDQEVKIPLKINFLRDKIIEKLIIETLILEEAKKFSIIVTDNQVNNVLKKFALKQNITLEELKKSIAMNNINTSFSYDDYIENIKKSLKIKTMQNYVLNNRINISEKEVDLFLNKLENDKNEVKKIDLNCIFLPFIKEKNKILIKNTKILVDRFMKKIKKNSSFDYYYEYFKKNNSIFSSQKIRFQSLKYLKKIFLKKLKITEKNQILGPILGLKGFYILKVNKIEKNSKEKFINEYHIQHCLIRPSVILDDKQARKDIFYIYNNIKNKKYSFNYAVKKLSHDVYSSNKEGDLGWISSDFFNNDFKKFLINLKKNEISKPIKSNYGWHIIKLLDIRQIDINDKIDKNTVYRILLEKKIKKERYNWIKELKKLSYIKIFKN